MNNWRVYLNGTSTTYLPNQDSTNTFINLTYITLVYTVEITGTAAGQNHLPQVFWSGLVVWLVIIVLVAGNSIVATLALRRKKRK